MKPRAAKLGVLRADIGRRGGGKLSRQDAVEFPGVLLPVLQHAGRADPHQLDAEPVGFGDDGRDLRLDVERAADRVVGAQTEENRFALMRLAEAFSLG